MLTTSLRGRPAILANGVRFLQMSETKTKVLWRCSYMATKSLKCPARITMHKGDPVVYHVNKSEHVHAELKRNKYYGKNEYVMPPSSGTGLGIARFYDETISVLYEDMDNEDADM